MRTTRQGGSVKVFIIVGVILVLAALGVLYGTKRYAMNDQTPPLVVPSGQDEVDRPEGDTSEPPSGESGAETKPDKDDDSSAESSQNKTGDQSTDRTDGSSNSGSSNSSGGDGSATSDSLPQTGPEGGLAGIILALVATSAIYYIRSLRK